MPQLLVDEFDAADDGYLGESCEVCGAPIDHEEDRVHHPDYFVCSEGCLHELNAEAVQQNIQN